MQQHEPSQKREVRIEGASIVAGQSRGSAGAPFTAIDPRTGASGDVVFREATIDDVAAACAAAAAAAPELAGWGDNAIGQLLRAIADELESIGPQLTAVADAETALGAERLDSERERTCGQLRAFAAFVESGDHHEAIIDTAAPSTEPPRPDVRRMLVPIGPVAVFGASNFPLAFGVPGGDTAAALAAGCPVVVKGHPSHPATSELTARAIVAACRHCAAPAGTFSLLQGGNAVGAALVQAPPVRAVGFTGSLSGGRALHDLAAERAYPIPVYAEMGSLNPVFVTQRALHERSEEIAAGLVSSTTMGTGQFCTKPGVVFVPSGEHADKFVLDVAQRLQQCQAMPMLSVAIRDAFVDRLRNSTAIHDVETIVAGGPLDGATTMIRPALLRCSLDTFLAHPTLQDEHFGPVTVIVSTEPARFPVAAEAIPGTLTATLQGGLGEVAELDGLLRVLRERAGRLIWNGFPTGLAVVAAQHHGGPYPATTSSGHTSVGVTAIRRFQRPVAYQDVPEFLLPEVLRDPNPLKVRRRVDGRWTRSPISTAPPASPALVSNGEDV